MKHWASLQIYFSTTSWICFWFYLWNPCQCVAVYKNNVTFGWFRSEEFVTLRKWCTHLFTGCINLCHNFLEKNLSHIISRLNEQIIYFVSFFGKIKESNVFYSNFLFTFLFLLIETDAHLWLNRTFAAHVCSHAATGDFKLMHPTAY